MQKITRIKLKNFKRFRDFDISLGSTMNTLIGDNEAGKSTILQSIEMAASGSRHMVESIGVEALLNQDAVCEFMAGDVSVDQLPDVIVELYLDNDNDPDLVGACNSESMQLAGIRMLLHPNPDLRREIIDALDGGAGCFPYEFYIAKFTTFSGEPFSGYSRPLKVLMIDSSKISGDYANNDYIRTVYGTWVDPVARLSLRNEYRNQKNIFENNYLAVVNDRLPDYKLALKNNLKNNLETDLTLKKDGISIDSKGKGQQCFVKTEFALKRVADRDDITVILLEEPENHLSHLHMKNLIRRISDSDIDQIIISTHSSLITSRLGLENSILLSKRSDSPVKLESLNRDTANFFKKAPNHNILEFVLSDKVLLVEGDAEYILAESFFHSHLGRSLEEVGVHVISVGGTSFKRYLELAKLLNIKTAVIRDNDGNYQLNCVDRYESYVTDNIKIFADDDNDRFTFEVGLYRDNENICNSVFENPRRILSTLDYMLKNKTDSALALLEAHNNRIVVPNYMREAFEWISG